MFLGYVVAIGGVVVAIILLVIATFNPPGFSGVRGLALDLTAPISAGGRGVVRGVSETGSAVADYVMAARRNAELKKELERSHQRLIEARAIELENRRLKRMLQLTEATTDEVTSARIVGSTFDASRRLATLSAGTRSGVQVGQPVRAPEGLIGRVLEAGRFASRVLLITDGASSVPVQMIRTGIPALATGRGDGTMDLKTLEVGQNPFRRGDVVVTSGIGGIYGPNIPVAIVMTANRDVTIARPLADPARIDFAIIQSIYQPAANSPLDRAAPPRSIPIAGPRTVPVAPPAAGARTQPAAGPRTQPGSGQATPRSQAPAAR